MADTPNTLHPRACVCSLQTFEYLIELGVARLVAKDTSETSVPLPFQVCFRRCDYAPGQPAATLLHLRDLTLRRGGCADGAAGAGAIHAAPDGRQR